MGPELVKMIAIEIVTVTVWLLIIFLLYIAAMTTVRVLQEPRLRKRHQEKQRENKYRPDGKPYPPAAEGMCDVCERAFDKVYHLPTGRRTCQGCYNRQEGLTDA